ncbi:MAG: type I pullulanase [Fimbriimonadaceae bacterium]|jgi:pullulanase|nr:type I pullulanase [Fimbriimonadaceae bacterium]
MACIRILKRIASGVCLLTLGTVAWGQSSAELAPAFLDRFDEVRIWLPDAVKPETVKGKIRLTIDGKVREIRSVSGGARLSQTGNPNFVVLAGTIQSALGANPWDPAGTITRMVRVTPDLFELTVKLPAGRYQYKVARGASWGENYGQNFTPNGNNIDLVLESPKIVKFVVNFKERWIRDSVNQPSLIQAPNVLPPTPTFPSDETEGKYQSVIARLAKPLTLSELSRQIKVRVANGPERIVISRGVLDEPASVYTGRDLGPTWTPRQTTFKVWSPIATKVDLLLFKSATSGVQRSIPMRRGPRGTWVATVPGNLDGTYYQYRLNSYGKTRYAADIYAKAASADSSRSVVLNLARTNPRGWPHPRLFQGKNHTDAVLYEIHVRDFTIHPMSGVRPEWRGKYLGLTQRGTKIPGTNFPTGLDYLKSLGVTHVHILPFQDFNPQHSNMYNWGYETTLFNVPEEQYAVNKTDPAARIREVKEMVLAMQQAGIGVVLDVVYNHSVPSEGPLSAFWELVPYFYFRTDDRGFVLNESGVGNALHDERPMVRKFIRESLEFWTREYRLDGYRFDLIGMFTRDSNADFARAIRRINPAAVIYGEPWTGGGPTRFGKGDQRGTGVAVFNDRFRGAFRGELDAAGPGFALGGVVDRNGLISALMGSVKDFTNSPQETVNYVSAHDNLTWWDRVALSLGSNNPLRESGVRLGTAAVLLAQGMPFLEGGVELGRTKNMNNNSYNAGDEANQYDWELAKKHQGLFRYTQGLIQLRRSQPGLRLATTEAVTTKMTFLSESQVPRQTIAYLVDGAKVGSGWREILVVLHGGLQASKMTLPSGSWSVAVEGDQAGTKALRQVSGTLPLAPLSATVLFRP